MSTISGLIITTIIILMIMMMLILIIMITFREESWFVLGCVMAISVLLAGLELVWSLQV